MKKKHICILAAAFVMIAAIIAVIVLTGRGSESDRYNYVALCLIEEGGYEEARTAAGYAMSDGEMAAQILVLSYLFEGDMALANECAETYLGGEESLQNEQTQTLAEWCGEEVPPGTGELLLFASTLKDSLSLNARERERLDQIVELQMYGNIASAEAFFAAELAEAGDEASMRAAAGLYAQQGNYAQTAALYTELVEKGSAAADKIALAGLTAYAGREILGVEVPQSDSQEEIEELTDEQEELWVRREAAQTAAEISELESEISEIQERISRLYEEAREYDIDCAIGYLRANNRGSDAGTGMDMALSLLYYIKNDEETAQRYLEQAMEQAHRNPRSYLAPQLNRLIWEYERDNGVSDAVRQRSIELAREIFQGLLPDTFTIPASDSGENYGQTWDSDYSYYYDFLLRMIRDLHTRFFIRYVDASGYPEVALHISLGDETMSIQEIEKAISGIRDMNEPVDKFTVEQSQEREMAICLVVDQSGSMSGEPLENAKRAILNFIRSANHGVRIGLVSFDNMAYLLSPVSGSHGMVSGAVDEIAASGGTYIPGGISQGIEALEGESGDKIIVVLSDGQDGSDAAPVIEEAKSRGVTIYCVGFGGADATYLSNIAEQTGGQFLQASDSGELGSIYQLIQGYIVNDYIVKYIVQSQIKEYEREVQVDMDDTSGDEAEYRVGLSMESVLEEEGLAPQSDFYRQTGGSGSEEGL